MSRALPILLLVICVWFAAAVATLAAYNAVKAAVIRRRAKVSLAALYAEAGIAP